MIRVFRAIRVIRVIRVIRAIRVVRVIRGKPQSARLGPLDHSGAHVDPRVRAEHGRHSRPPRLLLVIRAIRAIGVMTGCSGY